VEESCVHSAGSRNREKGTGLLPNRSPVLSRNMVVVGEPAAGQSKPSFSLLPHSSAGFGPRALFSGAWLWLFLVFSSPLADAWAAAVPQRGGISHGGGAPQRLFRQRRRVSPRAPKRGELQRRHRSFARPRSVPPTASPSRALLRYDAFFHAQLGGAQPQDAAAAALDAALRAHAQEAAQEAAQEQKQLGLPFVLSPRMPPSIPFSC